MYIWTAWSGYFFPNNKQRYKSVKTDKKKPNQERRSSLRNWKAPVPFIVFVSSIPWELILEPGLVCPRFHFNYERDTFFIKQGQQIIHTRHTKSLNLSLCHWYWSTKHINRRIYSFEKLWSTQEWQVFWNSTVQSSENVQRWESFSKCEQKGSNTVQVWIQL